MKTKILICMFLFFVFTTKSFSQQDSTKVKIGEQVPEFDYEITPGVIQNITDLKGKLVLINFFATWCGPCRQELPLIQKEIFDKYKDDNDFKLLIIGREHSWEEVNKFQTDNKYTMPFYPDPKRTIYAKFADQYIPRNFLISPEGKVIYSSIGFVEKDFENLKQQIKVQIRKIPIK